MTTIIGLTGRAGAGKSTVAEYLWECHNFERVRFADGLKGMMRSIGITDYFIEGDGKEKPHHLLNGKTARYAMQTLGTEWGRDIIGENFWVDLWKDRIDGRECVVAEDVRFHNEAAAIRAMGGVIINVSNQWAPLSVGTKHASEAQSILPDYTVDNPENDTDALFNRVEELLNAITKRTSKKVYLSGPMRGIPDFNYPAFHKAAATLRRAGYHVFNPAEIAEDYGGQDGFDMRQGFSEYTRLICEECDGIVMLPGWEGSAGARAELALAEVLELNVDFFSHGVTL